MERQLSVTLWGEKVLLVVTPCLEGLLASISMCKVKYGGKMAVKMRDPANLPE